jgi:3,4-dihydroxy-2-butanone 4-phosphate synthase
VKEEDLISEIDDMDMSAKFLEKFYDLADKLSIKIITIEEILELESKELVKETKI